MAAGGEAPEGRATEAVQATASSASSSLARGPRFELRDGMLLAGLAAVSRRDAEAVEAQDYLCKLPKRYGRLAERAMKKETGANHVPVEFSWVNGRLV